MTSKKTPSLPKSGTQIEYRPGDPRARCPWCGQPRNPLFQATADTHDIEDPAPVCARCWSAYHREAAEECPHCGPHLDATVHG